MNEKKFNLLNNVLGWLIFGVAAFVYLSTIEPTVSLWDCGEFIAGSYKLEVVHPPGAPFFLMLHRFFTMFAPETNPELVPVIVNGASAIWSAFAILFLFWTITLLARKFFVKNLSNVSIGEVISVFGAAIVGSLAFTFSDSFWFSAVEGEVYALSSFFTAVVFWLIMKWERRADRPHSFRFFVLIFYLMGIAIGVHLLSLLVLPVLAIAYYFKKYKEITGKGLLVAFGAGMLILFVINVGIIKWIPAIASKFEILFVNSFGLPYWSGVIFTLVLIFAAMGYGIYLTHVRGKVNMNVALVSIFMVTIGFSSYTMVAIRSNANTPIDYSNPDNIFNMVGYINREQYGDRPIFYGPQFTADPKGNAEGRKLYVRRDGKYKFIGHKQKLEYRSQDKMLFPRMSDTRADRADAYRSWSGMSANQKNPTFAQNMRYFFRYQLGHMYWRYFAWNFIGRQNDEQGHGPVISGGFLDGNWLSGVKFIDEARLGSQDNLPYAQRTNNAHNKLYFLPFLLGLLGMYFQFKKDKKGAWTVMGLFLITGILLIVYQNSPPFEPRERDYTLVGSFYAFSIWIGLGVLGIIDFVRKKLDLVPASVIAFLIAFFAVPVLMANQEWDDHDRSKRYTSRDYGINYLQSCAKDAVLFTNGDNDTYPLWYVQEVEGIRSDVRVINLQLLMTDWYVDQLRRQQNESSPIRFSFKPDQIVEGSRDYVPFAAHPNIDQKQFYDINELLNFIGSDDRYTKHPQYGLDYYPAPRIFVPVNKKEVLEHNVVREEFADRIVDSVKFSIGRQNLLKNKLMVLDIVANNTWERPVYFAITSGSDTYIGMQNYFQQEGMTYRLVPVRANKSESGGPGEDGRVDTKIMYENMMNKFQWGNLKDPDVYIGSVTRRHCQNYRNVFGTLAKALLAEGENEKCIAVIDKALEEMPEYQVPYILNTIQLAELYLRAGAVEKGAELAMRLGEVYTGNLDYYMTLESKFRNAADQEIQRNFYGLQLLSNLARTFELEEVKNYVEPNLQRLQNMGGIMPRQ